MEIAGQQIKRGFWSCQTAERQGQRSFLTTFGTGFNDFTQQADTSFTEKPAFAHGLGLTQDVTLQPAFQIGGNLLRKADQIFEKEQEYLLEVNARQPQNEPEFYVNDHG